MTETIRPRELEKTFPGDLRRIETFPEIRQRGRHPSDSTGDTIYEREARRDAQFDATLPDRWIGHAAEGSSRSGRKRLPALGLSGNLEAAGDDFQGSEYCEQRSITGVAIELPVDVRRDCEFRSNPDFRGSHDLPSTKLIGVTRLSSHQPPEVRFTDERVKRR